MDWFIVALVACAVVLPFLMASANPDGGRQIVQAATSTLAALGCVLMLSWMWFADGAHSRLWSWLPPFWPLGLYLTGTVPRWGLVGLLVLGTVLGLPSFIRAKKTTATNACVDNLRQLEEAKRAWNIDNHKISNGLPSWEDLRPYLPTGWENGRPLCPEGGVYVLGRTNELPRCSIGGQGHTLL